MTDARPAGITLSRKLLVLGALPAILMFLVLMGFFTSARLDDARQTLADNGQLLADSLAPALEYPVVSGNTQALEQILSQSLKNSLVDWIRVKPAMMGIRLMTMAAQTRAPPPFPTAETAQRNAPSLRGVT